MRKTISLHPREGYGIVPVTMVYQGSAIDVSLFLDTGAARTTVSDRLARDLGLPLITGGKPIDIHGVAGLVRGSLLSVGLVLFEEVSLAHEVQFAPFPALRVGVGRDSILCEGLLGNDLLRAANLRAVIDVPKGRAVLTTRDLR